LVIEIDGPTHFVYDFDRESKTSRYYPNLTTSFKKEMVRRMGFETVSVLNLGPSCEYIGQIEAVIERGYRL
jgi:hypothetical protein